MSTTTKRKVLAKFGKRGRWVKAVTDPRLALVRVQWKWVGPIKTESWTDTKENRQHAVAWAEGLYRRLTTGEEARPVEITMLELWEKYAEDQFPHLRQNSQRIYTENFRYWLKFIDETFLAESVTPHMVASFRRALEKQGLAVMNAKKIIDVVKMVYRWAASKELIQKNKVALYQFKIAKEARPTSPDEYSAEEFQQLLAAFDPEKHSQWRPYVALALCGYFGVRQNAALHLQWADIDYEANRITWRARWDKMGNEWSSPLRAPAIAALEVAKRWREKMGYEGPWVLPPARSTNKGETYDQQSLWWALKAGEDRAGITHRKRRAAHGLRRLLAGDVAALTGDPLLAMRAIGDRDIKMAERYVKKREDRVAEVFAQLDAKKEGES